MTAEQALRTGEERFRAAFDVMPDPLAIHTAIRDDTGQIVDFTTDFVNEAAVRYTGVPVATQLASTVLELYPAHRTNGLFDAYARVVETGEPLVLQSVAYEDPDAAGGAIRAALDIYAVKFGDGFVVTSRDVTAQRRTDEALREGESLLRSFFESPGAMRAIVEVDDGRTLHVVDNGEASAFFAQAEVPTQPRYARALGIPPEIEQLYLARYDESRRTGQAVRFEYRREIPSGVRWLEAIVWHVGTAANGRERYTSTARDITDRVLADAALRERERDLAEAQRIGRLGSWSLDPTTGATTWSSETYRILGRDPSGPAVDFADLSTVFTADSVRRATDAVERAVETGEPSQLDLEFLRPDGTRGWVAASGEIERDATGKILRIRGTMLDISERVATQARQTQLSSAVEQTADSVIIADLAGTIEYVNPAFERVSGYRRDEAIGQNPRILKSGRQPASFYKAMWRRLTRGQTWTGVLFNRRKDGSLYEANTTISPIRGPDGTTTGYVAVQRDVTELRAAETNLARAFRERVQADRERASLFEVIARSSNEVYIVDPETLLVRFANDGAGRNLGYTQEELATRTPLDLEPLLTEDALRARLAGLRGGGKRALDFETVHRRKDGSEYPVEVHLQLVETAEGEAALAITRDISKRVAGQAERARLASAIEQSSDAIAVGQIDGPIEYVNRGFERLYGYRREEVLGQNLRILSSGKHTHEFWVKVWDVVRGGETWSGSIVNRRKDGTLVEVETVVSAVRDAQGHVAGAIKTDRDVTRERSLEAQLRQAAKMEAIGQLAGGVAHDFNNMLTAIRGYTELVVRALPPSDEQDRADLGQVILASDRATELTRQLLAFARKQVLTPRVLDPSEVVAGIAPMLRRLLGENIELTVHAAPDTGQISVDAAQLEQVLLNLAVNARDAMLAGGKLTIETGTVALDAAYVAAHPDATVGPHVMLAVSDTGTGMDQATRERIFEPFFTTKPAGQGTGMGLATVYGIVKQSDGSIYVYSEPGHGTTFRLYFPRALDEPEARQQPAATEGTPTGRETILLVEDEPAVRAFSARTLADLGYRVIEAANGAEALAVAAAHPGPIDLLVTDVIMPGMHGADLAERLTAVRPGLRTLYVSGFTEDSVIHHGVAGVDVAYLPKPFSGEAIGRAVRAVLDGQPLR